MKQNVHSALMEINMDKQYGIKPNFSELSRRYGVDRHTVKKYYDSDGKPKAPRKARKSEFDPFADQIKSLIDGGANTLTAAFSYLSSHVEGFPTSYWSFHSYALSHGYTPKRKRTPHPRYETEAGVQMQFDWKEDIAIHTKDGKVIKKQIFSATLSFSRYHFFVVSDGKGTYDVLRCLIDVFRRLGGLPKTLLTDNMAAVVSITDGNRRKLPVFLQLEKDLGIGIDLCKPRHPFTKGKVEASNKFVERISAYDYRIDDERGFYDAIAEIQSESNLKPNETTRIPPMVLLKKELPFLRQLPKEAVLDTYVKERFVTKVTSSMLANCRGKGYSVPKEYIGKTVVAFPIGDEVIIQCGGSTIATHRMSDSLFNYKPADYREALSSLMDDQDKIDRMAEKNLKALEALK